MPAAAAELERAGYSQSSAELLARRGVTDPQSAEAFLNPRLEHLHDPRLLTGLDEAIVRLLRARQAGERIALVGDYDVDGLSGTALLTAVLRACGLEVRPIVPHRMQDGYGFQPVHVERAAAMGCSLIVTIDCGTTSFGAAEAALAAGIGVIVTDHHLPGLPLPAGVVQINPRQAACRYPCDDLSGAGLALKLALAFAEACERHVDPRILLRVACLGTIADLVPLRGENRVIAALGLAELRRTRSAGLRALIQVARVQPPISTSDIGFRLGPRLNAPGRLDSAEKALELLLCRDPVRASELAAELDQWNRERQDWERQAATEAREIFLGRSPLPPILVAWSDRWHRGVVGIAAGRLAREFHRPTLLLALDGNLATGSGRGLPGIHLYDFLGRWQERLARFGGHAQAIGLAVVPDRLAELRQEWEEAATVWDGVVGVRRLEYELDFRPADVTPEVFADLVRLEPHGPGNPQPLVRIRGPLHLVGAPRRFGRGHLSAAAAGPDGGRIRLLGWGWQEREAALADGFEAVGHLEQDRYRGGWVLRLVDSRPATTSDDSPADPQPPLT